MDPRFLAAISDAIDAGDVHAAVPSKPDTSAFGRAAEHVTYRRAARNDAGTGRPIPELHGASKDSAIRANIGGGPQANGGGGMARGDEIMRQKGQRAELAAGLSGLAVDLIVKGLISAVDVGIRYAAVRLEDRKAQREATASTSD
jgi:hypothetical protein